MEDNNNQEVENIETIVDSDVSANTDEISLGNNAIKISDDVVAVIAGVAQCSCSVTLIIVCDSGTLTTAVHRQVKRITLPNLIDGAVRFQL